MIKNVIFDLGNVLISFQPHRYLLSQGCTDEEADFLYREIFTSPEWVELDRGTITASQAVSTIKERNPEHRDLIEKHSDFFPVLNPIDENTSLLKKLKAEGFKLYFLTNYHDELFTRTREKHAFFDEFEGGVVSAHVKKIKPDPEIYRILMEKYSLNPVETLFIDDSKANTVTAEQLGMSVIHLENPNDLDRKLKEKISLR